MYDLRYSENPFDCPEMLIGLGVVLGMLGIAVITAICCYTCGKYRTQKNKKENKEAGKHSSSVRSSVYHRISRVIPWRYPNMQSEGSSERPVSIIYFAESLKSSMGTHKPPLH